MNGYDAQDMATQGAEGFRNGYQSGYADAVKAVEVGKPPAAQEAVAVVKIVGGATYDFQYLAAGLPDGEYALYAASVAAAPVDLIERCKEIIAWQKTGGLTGNALRAYADARWPDEHAKLQIAESETAREAYRILSVATATSTPAAPGIDMDAIKGAEDFIARHSYAWDGAGVHPNTVVTRLRALIYARPKGGQQE